MRTTRATGWILATVFLVIAIFAATWFFAVSPQLDSAAETRLQTQGITEQNAILQIQVDKLESDFANLETYKQELTALQLGMPAEARITDYTRKVEEIAAANGVLVSEILVGVPAVFAPAVPTAPVAPVEPTPAEGEEESDEETAEEETPAAAPAVDPAAGAPVIEGFVTVPVSIKVNAPYANATAFLSTLQTGTERLFLVSGLLGARQDQQEATPTKAAVAAGDLELTISGYIYVLQDSVAQIPVEGEAPSEPAPLPASPRNPFAPLPGTGVPVQEPAA